MSWDALKSYRQDFVLAVLVRAHRPMAAGEISEHIAVLAMGEGHDHAFWKALDPIAVSGHLRTLERKGLVLKDGERANARAGRPEPLWVPVQTYDRNFAIPYPPEDEEDEAAPAAPPALAAALGIASPDYAGLNRNQLCELLRVQDSMLGAVHRFITDVQSIVAGARRDLNAAGVDVPNE